MFDKTTIAEPKPKTTVRLGHRSARISLRTRRREAIKRLTEILAELEGKNIYIGSYDAGERHYWLENLKLPRLKVNWHPARLKEDASYAPGVIVPWGTRSAQVRIFTDYLVAVREQECQGYCLYLLDFRNGFWQNPMIASGLTTPASK